jgi:hypothetical protein
MMGMLTRKALGWNCRIVSSSEEKTVKGSRVSVQIVGNAVIVNSRCKTFQPLYSINTVKQTFILESSGSKAMRHLMSCSSNMMTQQQTCSFQSSSYYTTSFQLSVLSKIR